MIKMPTIKLNLKKSIDNSYEIVISDDGVSRMLRDFKKLPLGNKYAIITDDKINHLYGMKLLDTMKTHGFDCVLVSFGSGEVSKNLRTFEYLQEEILRNKLDRKSCIIALGGGVVGDVAGFVAGTYMRGINYIQVPTTLLAQVDSSIGGKSAVDLKGGKNMCGVFYQPKRVYIDISFLKTLPKKEIVNGLVEIIKHAVIFDKEMFDFLEKNVNDILNLKSSILIKTIKRSCEIKSMIVEQDTNEENLRKILNYGHTIGHALETITEYKKYAHGEAIAIGMALEGRISNLMGWLSAGELDRQNAILKKIGLSLSLPDIDINHILEELMKDKKAVSAQVYFVLPERIGRMKSINGMYGINVPLDILYRILSTK